MWIFIISSQGDIFFAKIFFFQILFSSKYFVTGNGTQLIIFWRLKFLGWKNIKLWKKIFSTKKCSLILLRVFFCYINKDQRRRNLKINCLVQNFKNIVKILSISGFSDIRFYKFESLKSSRVQKWLKFDRIIILKTSPDRNLSILQNFTFLLPILVFRWSWLTPLIGFL